MKRVVLLFLMAATLVAPAVSGTQAGASSSAIVQPGTYKCRDLNGDGSVSYRFVLRLNADGTGSVPRQGGYTVTWTQTRTDVTITVSASGGMYWTKYTGRITGKGFGNRATPGTFISWDGSTGNWYGVKVA